jgi:DNA recombination protein RmuC
VDFQTIASILESTALGWFGLSLLLLVVTFLQWRAHTRATSQVRLAQNECEKLQAEVATFASLEEQLQSERLEASELRVDRDTLAADMIRMEERLRHETRSGEEKVELLTAARKQLSDEFQSLAGKIFDEKRQHFTRDSKQVLDGALNPLREQLKDFKAKVEDVYDKESKERLSLLHEVGQLKNLNEQMSQDAVNLTRALKGDKKTQGNWGEVILERVLQESGLRNGHEYFTQESYLTEDGKRRVPDVVVRLPEEKDIVIDSKVSLVDYEQYASSEDDQERAGALKRHIQAIKNHIEGLSFKDYEKLEGLRTLDFVLIFIPIESAFIAAFDADPTMFGQAYEKHIIVVSPTTLLATLRTVSSIWRYEQQNRNAEKIAAQAGAIHDQFVLVVETLNELDRHLEKSREAFDHTMRRLSTGRGNLSNRVVQLEKLGARTKRKLPKNVVEFDGDEEPAVLDIKPDDDDDKSS